MWGEAVPGVSGWKGAAAGVAGRAYSRGTPPQDCSEHWGAGVQEGQEEFLV